MSATEEIEKIEKTFRSTYITAQYFQVTIYRSIYLSTLLVNDYPKKSISRKSFINAEVVDSIKKYEKSMSHFSSPEDFDKVIIEKGFVDRFQVFEVLLYEIVFTLYKNFPKFLNKGDSSIGVTINDLYSQVDIEELKNMVIAFKTRQIIQANSIINTMRQIEKAFGITFNLKEDDIKQIHLISKLRNLIIHNGSKMNQIVLKELSNENVSVKLKTGENIITFIKANEKAFGDLLWSTGNAVVNKVREKLNQISKYHESIS